MDENWFRMNLYLPAQGASEAEATIIEWRVSAGDAFAKGQVLAQIDSVKSVFDFEAPCSGRVVQVLRPDGDSVPYADPVLEIETNDPSMKDWIPPAAAVAAPIAVLPAAAVGPDRRLGGEQAVILGLGGYLPERVVANAELLEGFPDISEQYIYQVTGIRQRRWAGEHEKPSDMAYAAALEAIRRAKIPVKEIDAIILSTTTPDVAMPSTACILQDRLGLGRIPAFDLNAACSGWLYAAAMANSMIATGMARNVLTVGVDMQSRLLDRNDRTTCFLFGDGAGAAIIGAGQQGHRLRSSVLGSDTRGLHMAGRAMPGYEMANGDAAHDPWIRLDGHALFRFATEAFAVVIRDALARSGWRPDETQWVIPHQANSRILKAVAKRSGVPFDRFFLNLELLGNTSSASIPLALIEAEAQLQPDDKIVLCSVGAGATMAAMAVEW